jgi:hypothetical protein
MSSNGQMIIPKDARTPAAALVSAVGSGPRLRERDPAVIGVALSR